MRCEAIGNSGEIGFRIVQVATPVQNVLSRNSEAKKRFGLCVLDYVVTSNHIQLLVKDMYSCAVRPASSKGFKRSTRLPNGARL